MMADWSVVFAMIWIVDDQALRQHLEKWTQEEENILIAHYQQKPGSGTLWDDSTLDQASLRRSLTCEFLSVAKWLWTAWDPIRDELKRAAPDQQAEVRAGYLVRSWLGFRKAPSEFWLAANLKSFTEAKGDEAILHLVDVVLREVPVVPVDKGAYLHLRSLALEIVLDKLKEYRIPVSDARMDSWKKLIADG